MTGLDPGFGQIVVEGTLGNPQDLADFRDAVPAFLMEA
jgi:hypothetical protein